MSRGYSRGGGGLTIILAIIGTLIVVVVGIFLYSKFSGSSVFGAGASPTPTIMLPTSEPTPTLLPSPSFVPIIPTAEPTPSPTATVDLLAEPTATIAQITAAPNFQTVTVAVASLKVRSSASSSGTSLGSVKYGQTYEVTAESGKWVQIRYNNTFGWIYTGYDSSGDLCAVRGSTPVPPMPEPDAAPSFLKEVSISGNILTVKFTTGVYGNKEHTTSLAASQLTVKEGGSSLTFSLSHTAGSDTATLTLGPTSGGTITVSIGSNSIYNAVGTASPSGSKSTGSGSADNTAPTFSISKSGLQVILTFSENVYADYSGGTASGDLGSGDFTVVSNGTVDSVSHSGGNKTVTITMSAGTTGVVTVTLHSSSAWDAAGNAAGQDSKSVTLG